MSPGWAMTNPNKLTLLTPGFTDKGYAEHGVPAPIVAEYLRQNRDLCGPSRHFSGAKLSPRPT
jgi:arginine/lysine/ornithine decarboxylase